MQLSAEALRHDGYTAREVLIKSGMQITQTDFLSDCTKVTQEYLMYFKEFSCNMMKNMQVRCVPRFIQRFPSMADIRRPYALQTAKSDKAPHSKTG